MESGPVRRKSCLLRLRDNCPFRKLRRQTYDVSAASSSPIGSCWNNIGPPVSNQPISTVHSEPLPPPFRCRSVCSANQSKAAADIQMEEDPPAAENQQNLQNQQNYQNQQHREEDCMDLDDIDPETGERAQE